MKIKHPTQQEVNDTSYEEIQNNRNNIAENKLIMWILGFLGTVVFALITNWALTASTQIKDMDLRVDKVEQIQAAKEVQFEDLSKKMDRMDQKLDVVIDNQNSRR